MSDTSLHVYEIDDGETWHYVAATPERAIELFVFDTWGRSATVEEYMKECPETTVIQCADDKVLIIRFEAESAGEEDYEEEKTFGEWARENDEGVLCSSMW